jgi:multicomponent Na+:H+ antiporter subunit D
VFSGVLRPDIEHLRVVLVIAGTLTALVGATMCFVQYHLKRLLAFSAVAHGGLMVAGVGLLGPIALAGVAVYVLGHACVKAALFLATGLLRARCGTLNEMELHGRGRERALRVAAVVFVLGALGLAGVPPFGTFAGKSLLEDGARHAGMSWLVPVVVVVSAVTAGALLRATGRVFLGWGSRQAAATAITAPEGLYAGDEVTEEPEVRASGRRLPVSMWAPAVALVAAGFLVGLVPGITTGAEHAAARVVDQPAYEARVLRGRDLPVRAPAASSYPTAGAVGTSGAALAGAIVLAGLALGLERVPDRFRRAGRSLVPPVRALRLLQSGHAGDYVAFVIAGTAVFGSAVALAVR